MSEYLGNLRYFAFWIIFEHLPLQSLMIPAIKIMAETKEDTVITANPATIIAAGSILTLEWRKVDVLR